MNRFVKRLSVALSLTSSITLISACSIFNSNAADERWANYQEWTKLNSKPITGDHTGFLGNLHRGKEGVREVYVNDIGANTAKQILESYVYPVGTIIVKEQFKSMDLWKDRKGATLTIMVKVTNSTPNAASDWRWSSGFSKQAKDDPFCSGCHTIAMNQDFSFSNGRSLNAFQAD